MSAPTALILAASVRPGGNSDLAARIAAEGATVCGYEPEIVHVRDYRINPCTACGSCFVSSAPCPAAQGDDSEELFQKVLACRHLVIASPIYFYHLPAIFKLFIDRAQYYYGQREQKDSVLLQRPSQAFHCVMVSGRPRGEQLFAGSLLTLKFFLAPFNFYPARPLLIRGLDQVSDLASRAWIQDDIRDYIRQAFTWAL